MNARFTNKVMVITGAAQGIGKRVAELAAAEGGHLVLVDIADYVQDVAVQLQDRGAEALAVQANLETWEGAETVMAKAYEAFGRIDVLINNVGGTIWAQPFEHYKPEQIEKEIQRSLFPTLWCCRAVLPYMLDQQGGSIVNVSSVATRGLMRVPYGAAKGGVNAMTVNLAYEYAGHNIRVNATAADSP
jgi:dihydroxycyclohexadiene carboxylate dehydrogenase